MISKTFSVASLPALEEQLANLQTDQPFKPSFAFVFASIAHSIDDIMNIFNRYEISIIGCSSAGEIVDDRLYEQEIGVMLLDMPADAFCIVQTDHDQTELDVAANTLSTAALQTFDNPAIILLLSGIEVDAEYLTEALKLRMGESVCLFGGMAGDDFRLQETYVFGNYQISSQGLIALVVDNNKIAIEGMAYSGWEAIGIEHTVTEARGTTVYTINNEPALDVFLRYFGYYGNLNNDRDVATSQYPMQVKRKGGYSVLRSPTIAKENERAIVLAGKVKAGEKFHFSVSPGFEVIDSTIAGFEKMKKQQTYSPDALLLFSCKGRHASLGPLIEDEISRLHQCWNKPMIGFLSYGEIGCVENGFCDFHNETCTLVTLKEL
ncbi:MAG: FIST C-terminal domain-containing protein [Sphingobacteriales bacterium]|nr:FIST C-terminal domain-containing protein [Sphingobacteriales bacterium]MCC7224146.1 FIST C-terminal domain-containing protein [Chitinophagales bacterium]